MSNFIRYGLKKIFKFITKPYRLYKEQQKFAKKMEDLRKRDPFIYK